MIGGEARNFLILRHNVGGLIGVMRTNIQSRLEKSGMMCQNKSSAFLLFLQNPELHSAIVAQNQHETSDLLSNHTTNFEDHHISHPDRFNLGHGRHPNVAPNRTVWQGCKSEFSLPDFGGRMSGNKSPKTIATINFKGGVGNTTESAELCNSARSLRR